MGEARRKLMQAGMVVTFDYGAPSLHIVRGDRVGLSRDGDGEVSEEKVVSRAVRFVMTSIVNAAFPQGMARRDGQTWAAWQETMDEEETPTVEVTVGQVEWLKKHVGNDDLKLQPALAQWREAVAEYLDTLTPQETDGEGPN